MQSVQWCYIRLCIELNVAVVETEDQMWFKQLSAVHRKTVTTVDSVEFTTNRIIYGLIECRVCFVRA